MKRTKGISSLLTAATTLGSSIVYRHIDIAPDPPCSSRESFEYIFYEAAAS